MNPFLMLLQAGFNMGSYLMQDEALSEVDRWNDVAARQAIAAEQAAAADALRRAAVQGSLVRMQSRATVGAQQVAYSAAGIDASQGTALRVGEQTFASLEELAAVNNGVREALGYQTTALSLRNQRNVQGADFARQRKALQLQTYAGHIGAATTGMSGAK